MPGFSTALDEPVSVGYLTHRTLSGWEYYALGRLVLCTARDRRDHAVEYYYWRPRGLWFPRPKGGRGCPYGWLRRGTMRAVRLERLLRPMPRPWERHDLRVARERGLIWRDELYPVVDTILRGEDQ